MKVLTGVSFNLIAYKVQAGRSNVKGVVARCADLLDGWGDIALKTELSQGERLGITYSGG